MQRLRTPERRDPLADVGSRLVFEFGGTFFLCLSYALVEPAARPVAVSCAVTALVYAGGHVSGGHCNPAVTVATWLAARQEQNFVNTAFYLGTQIAAAVAASKVAGLLALVQPGSAGSSCAAPYPQVPSVAGACVQTSSCTACPGVVGLEVVTAADCASNTGCTYTPAVNATTSFAAEVIGVAVLCFVMLHTTTTRATANNSFFGIAAGFSVLSAMTTFGSLSGGAFNPAIAMLYVAYPASAGATLPNDGIGRFWSAGMLGAAIASVLFRITAVASEFRKADAGISYRYQRKCGARISSYLGHYLMEVIGTTYLALVVSTMRAASDNNSSAAPSTQPLAALSLGAAYTAMVSAGGHSSGGHYSPSLSVADMIRNNSCIVDEGSNAFGIVRTVIYVGMQVFGAVCGGWIARYLGQSGCLMPPSTAISGGSLNAGPVWAAEALGSGLLVFVVCHVATLRSTTGNSYFSVAAGFALAVCTMMFSGISGGVFNPAIALGLGMTMTTADEAKCTDYMWIYAAASSLGAVGGVALFALTAGGTGLFEMDADGGERKSARRFGLHVRSQNMI